MTPTTQIQDFLNAAALVKTGLTQMFQALSAIEAVALDWAEASGNLGEYNTPPAPEPVVTPTPEPTQTTVPAQPDQTPENPPQTAQTTMPADVPAEVEKPVSETTPTAPEPAHTISLEDVRALATALIERGQSDIIRGILNQYGVNKLTELPAEHYPAAVEIISQTLNPPQES